MAVPRTVSLFVILVAILGLSAQTSFALNTITHSRATLVTSNTKFAFTIDGEIDIEPPTVPLKIYDAILLGNAFGSRPGDPNWNPKFDFNGDGVINILDAIIFAIHFEDPNFI